MIQNVLVSGSTGLIGSRVVSVLENEGRNVRRLVRTAAAKQEGDVLWNPTENRLDSREVAGLDAAIHLAGENIVGRWTERKRARIRASRVDGTRLLCRAMARLDPPPRVLICASAVGYYGDRGDEVVSEDSPAGQGFLADVAREWEAVANEAAEGGTRVVLLRIGMVLDRAGGALAKMLPLFKLGLGGKLGNGKQYVSWISLDDLVSVIQFVLNHEELNGPINAVSPEPVTNLEFTRTLGNALSRPAMLPAPAFALRLLYGKMADEVLLSGARVEPERLLKAGFRFMHPDLRSAFLDLLQ